jgi:hypothetical protein
VTVIGMLGKVDLRDRSDRRERRTSPLNTPDRMPFPSPWLSSPGFLPVRASCSIFFTPKPGRNDDPIAIDHQGASAVRFRYRLKSFVTISEDHFSINFSYVYSTLRFLWAFRSSVSLFIFGNYIIFLVNDGRELLEIRTMPSGRILRARHGGAKMRLENGIYGVGGQPHSVFHRRKRFPGQELGDKDRTNRVRPARGGRSMVDSQFNIFLKWGSGLVSHF